MEENFILKQSKDIAKIENSKIDKGKVEKSQFSCEEKDSRCQTPDIPTTEPFGRSCRSSIRFNGDESERFTPRIRVPVFNFLKPFKTIVIA